MPLTVAFAGIANPKLLATNTCANAFPVPDTEAFELLLDTIFAGDVHAVPAPELTPLAGNKAAVETGA